MSVAEIKEAVGRGDEHLGDMVWWTIREARIARALLLDTWKQEGLPEALLPEEPSPEKALGTAVREGRVGRLDYQILKSLETPERVSYAILRKQPDGDGNLGTVQEARLDLDRVAGKLQSGLHPVAQAVMTAWNELCTTHTSDDLRGVLVKAVDAFQGVKLRPTGGIYWIPAVHAGKLRAVERAVKQISTGSQLTLIAVTRMNGNATNLAGAAQGALEGELAALKAEIEAWATAPPSRISTLASRVEAFQALRDKADLYRGILSVEVSALDAGLDTLTENVRRMIEAKEAEKRE